MMADDFLATFGHEPEGIWAAPGRINLIGEFTDYNQGFVLPIALHLVTRASVARRDDQLVCVKSTGSPAAHESLVEASLDSLSPRGGGFWTDYIFGVIWALVDAGHHLPGLEISIASEVPIGAGLSSSAALECAIGLALRDLFAPGLDLKSLASIAQHAENAFVGVPTGIMDQTASLRCISGHALLLDTRSGEIEQLPFDLERADLGLAVLDTGIRRELASSAYAGRRSACEEAARIMGVPALRDATTAQLSRIDDAVVRRRARHVIVENERVLDFARLLRVDRTAEIGPLITASHRSLRDDFEVSSRELDLAVDAAVAAGALGARMIGGGFGGCAIALTRRGALPAIADAVTRAFAEADYRKPTVFTAVAAGGARRLS